MKTFIKEVKIETPEFEVILIVNDNKAKVAEIIDLHIKNKKEKKKIKEGVIAAINENCRGCYVKEGLSRLMLFTDWKNNWDHWDSLNHEITHLVDYEAKYGGFEDEMEFKAYLHESLFKKFREILKKI